MKRRTLSRQLGLLEPRRVVPMWTALPVETRGEVLRLLLRMLKEHVVGLTPGARKGEVGRE